MEEIRALAEMAITQPHAAYVVLTKALLGRWRYHLRCTPCPSTVLKSVDEFIDSTLLPALSGHAISVNCPQRELLSLQTRYGGLAIPSLDVLAPIEYETSVSVTKPLVQLIVPDIGERLQCDSSLQQSCPILRERPSLDSPRFPSTCPSRMVSDENLRQPEPLTNQVIEIVGEVRSNARQSRWQREESYQKRVREIRDELPPAQRLLVQLAGEKGVSSWLTAMPDIKSPCDDPEQGRL